MDPLSISASCVSLVATITKVSYSVTVFVREVRDARSDLDLISHELHSLKTVLELLSDDFAQPTSSALPSTLVTHLGGILKNCNMVVNDIDQSLEKHRSSRIGVGGHWTLGGGKDDMTKFRFSLETHKSALELALEMVAITIIRDVKKDTEAIREDTAAIPDIKNDTAQILQIVEEIARLKARLPEDVTQSGPNLMLQRFLDDSTTYAETVVNDSIADEPESPVFDTSAHGTDWSNKRYVYHDNSQSPSIPQPLPYDYRGNSQRPANPLEWVFAGMDQRATSRSANLSMESETLRSPSEDGQTARVAQKASQRTTRPADAQLESEFSSSWTKQSFPKKTSTNPEDSMPRLTSNPSELFYIPVQPSNLSIDTRQAENLNPGERPAPTENRPTSRKVYNNIFARPGIDWKYFSEEHTVIPPIGEDGITNWNTHRYTALACTPSELAKTDFTFRQISQQRETMLMIGVHCFKDPLPKDEFDARIGTTLESVVESLTRMEKRCGGTRSGLWWGETVVVCLLHCYDGPSTNLGTYGLRAICSSKSSDGCGMQIHNFQDGNIRAHMWEVTSLATKFTWDRRGHAGVTEKGPAPLQLINVAYAKPFREFIIPGDVQHLSPFIQMLGAKSCISIMAGDKIELNDVLAAYAATSWALSTIEASSEPPEDDLGSAKAFFEVDSKVPTRIYEAERALNFDAGKRSMRTRISRLFG